MTIGQAPEQLFGREVTDSSGNKIGSVDGVWVDDATDKLEFVGVKTGWLGGKRISSRPRTHRWPGRGSRCPIRRTR